MNDNEKELANNLNKLSSELSMWVKPLGLFSGSADEMLHDILWEIRVLEDEAEYLKDFIIRWDRVMEGGAAEL